MKQKIVVAVLTYRRNHLLGALLVKLLEEVRSVTSEYDADVLVVDNDPRGSAKPIVDSLGRGDVHYALETRPGISAARNRALEEASGYDALVFIDDDETPAPNWLNSLLDVRHRTGAAGVAGAMIRDYPQPRDPWLEAGGYGIRPRYPTGTPLRVAPTSNLLLDLGQIRRCGIRFDERFGASGGEDTMFTRTMTYLGLPLVWCDEAVVHDFVPPDRMSRKWHLLQSLSHGNGDGLVELALAHSSPRAIVRVSLMMKGAIRVAGGGMRVLILSRLGNSVVHTSRGLRTATRGIGMMMSSMGIVYNEYSRPLEESARGERKLGLFGRNTTCRETGKTAQPMTVLLSFPPTTPRGNPYRAMLENSIRAEPNVRVLNFRWRSAILGRYEIFHVHWPEILITGTRAWKQFLKQVLFVLLLVRISVTGVAVVETVHNIELPAGLSRSQVRLLRRLRRVVTLRIRLNDSTSLPKDRPVATILHGHYRKWYSGFEQPARISGHLAFVGLVRHYKNVDGLIRAFAQTASTAPDLTLHIVGYPSTDELRGILRELAAPDQRIHLHLDFVAEDEFVRQVCTSELVVLPYREMHNSAAVLTVLSLGRPVLVPDNGVNRRLRDEVGAAWVWMYDGELTGAGILNALNGLRSNALGGKPDLDGRSWDGAGCAHVQAYARARTKKWARAAPWLCGSKSRRRSEPGSSDDRRDAYADVGHSSCGLG